MDAQLLPDDDLEFGLVGRVLGHSFSRAFFSEKFRTLHLDRYRYSNFELPSIAGLHGLLEAHPRLVGFQVTLPYKEAILPYLSGLSEDAEAIGAVNTVVSTDRGLVGFNTDADGFAHTLDLVGMAAGGQAVNALVLGTGGAARAVLYVLHSLGIPARTVSRSPQTGDFTYGTLPANIFTSHKLLVNTTPLGMYPETGRAPAIDYRLLGPGHTMIDLVYNPEKTLFLNRGEAQGCRIQNGLPMLYHQAEKTWEIWKTHLLAHE